VHEHSFLPALDSPDPKTGEIKIKLRLGHDEHGGADGSIETSVDIVISEDREIKIFISSPFTDMQEERDLMVKKVFPKLRKLCDERDVSMSYVDLRWGITGSQSQQGAMLLMCLREIKNSNLFIGCYGERYGSCIDLEEVDELKAADQQPRYTSRQNINNNRNLNDLSRYLVFCSDNAKSPPSDDFGWYDEVEEDDVLHEIRNVSQKGAQDKVTKEHEAKQALIASLETKNELIKNSFDLGSSEFPWIEKFRDKSMTELEFRMVPPPSLPRCHPNMS